MISNGETVNAIQTVGEKYVPETSRRYRGDLSRTQSRLSAGRAGFRSTGIPKEKKPRLLSRGAS